MTPYQDLRPEPGESESERATKRRTVRGIIRLREALAAHFAAAGTLDGLNSDYVRIATWNIRLFGANSYGGRLPESYYYIAEIINHFDLVGLQEVRSDLTAFRHLLTLLGPDWNFLATDVTEGSAGNDERLVYLYRKSKVRFTGIAGELVLADEDRIPEPHATRLRLCGGLCVLPDGEELTFDGDADIYRGGTRHGRYTRLRNEVTIDLPPGTSFQLPEGAKLVLPRRHDITETADGRLDLAATPSLDHPDVMLQLGEDSFLGDGLQFARTPYLVSFRAGWLELNLCTVHIIYGEGAQGLERRQREIEALTHMLSRRASAMARDQDEAVFIALGDFNIHDKQHGTMEALVSNDFSIPEPLQSLPPTNAKRDAFYDQIACWTGHTPSLTRVTEIDVARAGVFDFFLHVFRDEDESSYAAEVDRLEGYKPFKKYEDWRTYQLSDHFPMWAELRTGFAQIALHLTAQLLK